MFGLAGLRLYAALGAAALLVAFALWVFRIDSLRAQHKREAVQCEQNFAQFRADVKAQTELARISDAAHKAEVERDQERIRSENDEESRRRIADAVSRVRNDQARARGSGSSRAPVPGTPNAPGGPSGGSEAPFVDADDAVICTENTVKLEGWADWWREVSAVPR